MDISVISKILRDSNYQLEQFTQEDQQYLVEQIFVKENKHGTQDYYVKCLKRKKDIKLTPEEVVRQLFIFKLHNHYGYPLDRIEVEYSVNFGIEKKRADIVVMSEIEKTQ